MNKNFQKKFKNFVKKHFNPSRCFMLAKNYCTPFFICIKKIFLKFRALKVVKINLEKIKPKAEKRTPL